MSATTEAARAELYKVAEVTYGTTPANPAWRRVRHNSTTIAGTPEVLISDELAEHQQVTDTVIGRHNAGGDIQCEFSKQNSDDFIAAAMRSTFSPIADYAAITTISFAAADNSLNDSAGEFPTYRPGDTITITGSTSNNGTGVIVSATASKIVISGLTLVNEPAGDAVTIANSTDRCRVGYTFASFSLLRRFRDTSLFQTINGAVINSLAVNIGQGITMLGFGLLCREAGDIGGSAPSGSTYAEPLDVEIPFTGTVGGITVDGTSAPVSEVSFTIENGYTPRPVVGSAFTEQPAKGRLNVTGQLVAYFESATLLNAFLDGSDVELVVTAEHSDGSFYRFVLPRIKFTGGQPDATQQGAITLTLPFQAAYDATEESTITIERDLA
jgi:hypothetical protein